MVAASTKIKQAAAQAFEPESVERDDFTINKPEGFMSPLDDVSGFEFEARSREYGEKKTRNVWRAHAVLTAAVGANFQAECAKVKAEAGEIVSERILNSGAGGEKVFLLESEETENNVPMIVFKKIVESRARKKIYCLRISVLPEYRAAYLERVNELTNSFRLK